MHPRPNSTSVSRTRTLCQEQRGACWSLELGVAVRLQPSGVNAPWSLSSGSPTHPFPVHTSTPFLACSRQQRNTYGQASFQVGSGGVLGGFPVAPKRAARSISPGAGRVPSSLDGGPCSFSVLLSTISQESTTSPLLSVQGSVLQRLCSAFLKWGLVQVG